MGSSREAKSIDLEVAIACEALRHDQASFPIAELH
jgi:hypothetical protein